MEGRGLEHVQEDMGVLTVEGIGPRWPERGDRRECSAFGEETEEKELERAGSQAAQLAARRACDGGREQTGAPFIDETRRWRRGAAVVADGQLCSAPSMAWGQLRLLAGVAERRER